MAMTAQTGFSRTLAQGAQAKDAKGAQGGQGAQRAQAQAAADEADFTIHIHGHHLHFTGPISRASTVALCNELRKLARQLRIMAVTNDTALPPLVLHMTTEGGDLYAAMTVVDCLDTLQVPVHSVVEGLVASAGTLITMAAARRVIRPNAYMLIHQLSSVAWGTMSQMEDELRNLRKLQQHLQTFYVSRCTLTARQVQQMLLKDETWNSQECLAKGFVDAIE